jgi:hypothetical protein
MIEKLVIVNKDELSFDSKITIQDNMSFLKPICIGVYDDKNTAFIELEESQVEDLIYYLIKILTERKAQNEQE